MRSNEDWRIRFFSTCLGLSIPLLTVGFPDSMSMELHAKSSIRDSTFFFRIRRRPSGHDEVSQAAASSQNSAERGHYHNQRQEYLYGYASTLTSWQLLACLIHLSAVMAVRLDKAYLQRLPNLAMSLTSLQDTATLCSSRLSILMPANRWHLLLFPPFESILPEC